MLLEFGSILLRRAQAHVVLLPSAGMGHLAPFLRLAALLSQNHRCQLTLITTHPTISLAESSFISGFLSRHSSPFPPPRVFSYIFFTSSTRMPSLFAYYHVVATTMNLGFSDDVIEIPSITPAVPISSVPPLRFNGILIKIELRNLDQMIQIEGIPLKFGRRGDD